jgi:hypothetical protein
MSIHIPTMVSHLSLTLGNGTYIIKKCYITAIESNDRKWKIGLFPLLIEVKGVVHAKNISRRGIPKHQEYLECHNKDLGYLQINDMIMVGDMVVRMPS